MVVLPLKSRHTAKKTRTARQYKTNRPALCFLALLENPPFQSKHTSKTRIIDNQIPDVYTAETLYLTDLVEGGSSLAVDRPRHMEQHMKARILGWAFLIICLAVFVPVSYAQYRAALQGSVLDPQGDVVSGATVTLVNLETNFTQTVTTNSAGVYNFSSLPPGHFSITVEKQGFTKKSLADVQVAAEQIQSVNVSLEVGQVSQTVTVSGSSTPPIDTETGQISGTLNANEVQNLPSFGRDPFQLLRLAPGVFGEGAHDNGGGSQDLPGNAGPGGSSATTSIFQTENQVQISANGQRNDGNNFQVDGVSVNSLDWGGAAIITPNEESVKEVRITANSYDAEYGRGNGAQVEVVSESGTNSYHGSLFIKLDRPGLNAIQPWNGPGSPGADQAVTNRFNQFGGSVGGAIIKNRLFAFFSYETLRNNSTSTGTAWVETPQYLAAVAGLTGNISGKLLSYPGEGASYSTVLSSSCSQINMPATNCQAVGTGLDIGSFSTVGYGQLDPTYGQTLTPYGVGGGLDGVPDIQYVVATNPNTNTSTQYNGRMDFQATHSDLFTYSIYWVPNASTFYNGQARPANLWNHDALNYSESLMWNHTFSSTFVNEARFNVGRWYYNELSTNPQEPFGLPNDSINCLGGACGIDYGANGPGILYKTGYNIRDIATKILNSQSMKFGVDIYKEQNTQTQAGGARPNYQFNNLWDFANDAPVGENGQFNPLTGVPTSLTSYVRDNDYALFFQDDWKLKPNLTVNLGLRYEYFGPFHEKYNNLVVPIFGEAPNQLPDLSLRLGGNLYHASKHDFGPQLGFAWSPSKIINHDLSNHLVIRGGFGIGFNRTENGPTLGALLNPSPLFANFSLFGSNILYAVPSDPKQFAPYPANPNAVLTFNPSTNLPASGAPVDLEVFPQNLVTPYTYRYSLLAQYDLGHDVIATVGYQGSSTHRLLRWNYDGQIQFPIQNPQIQGVNYFEDDVNSNYNALLTEVQKRFSHNFEVDFQYTWSRALDEASNNYYFDQYPFNAQAAYGPSDNNATNQFKLWGLWSPSFFAGGWKHKVIDGWTASGIWSAHSGFPWTPYYNVQVTGDANECSLVFANSGYCQVRPAAYVGGAGTNYSNSTFKQMLGNFPNGPETYFTPPTLSATGVPPAPGVGRNSFRGPGYSSVDFTLSKAFGLPNMRVIGENGKLEIRANFYNLFNQLNLGPLGTQQIGTIQVTPTGQINPTAGNGLASTTFSQSGYGLAGRVIEAQARFSF